MQYTKQFVESISREARDELEPYFVQMYSEGNKCYFERAITVKGVSVPSMLYVDNSERVPY